MLSTPRFRAQIVAGVTAVAISGCGAVAAAPAIGSHSDSHEIARLIRPQDYFLTVTTTPSVTRNDSQFAVQLVRYPASTLQLRSVRHGRVVATLLHSLGSLDAVMAGNGTVIAVADYGCRSQILRIELRTGHAELIRTLPQSATDVALSRSGEQLAYVTYPASDQQPCTPSSQPARPVREELNPGGPIQYLPNVLTIVNLATGARVQTATGSQGDPISGAAWSPDGTSIAVTTAGGSAVSLVSAAHPDLATASQLRPPRRCGYVTAAWTVSGIVAVLGCGKQGADLSPQTLVRLSSAGKVTARWRLPGCIDGVSTFADPAGQHVLIQANIGYGNGRPCGYPRPGGTSIRIAIVGPAALSTVAVFPQDSSELQATGW
jgi:hypothetical protein